jgi:Macrocin-O-methyltransferase (TylF)
MANYTPHNKTTLTQKENRQKLYDLYSQSPIPADEMLINAGLYMRSSALSKLLFLDEAYRHIINIPGNIMVFGTWWGQDVTVFYNLRAVHEPYNFTRKVIGFDTFTGYPSPATNDNLSDTIKEGAYSTAENYKAHLDELMAYHERENIMSHIKKYELIEGDILKTLPEYCTKNKHELISLVYIDVALYEPTKIILEQCLPNMVKGSVIVFDELNAAEYPGETIALKESGLLKKCTLIRSHILPDRSYLIYNG